MLYYIIVLYLIVYIYIMYIDVFLNYKTQIVMCMMILVELRTLVTIHVSCLHNSHWTGE